MIELARPTHLQHFHALLEWLLEVLLLLYEIEHRALRRLQFQTILRSDMVASVVSPDPFGRHSSPVNSPSIFGVVRSIVSLVEYAV